MVTAPRWGRRGRRSLPAAARPATTGSRRLRGRAAGSRQVARNITYPLRTWSMAMSNVSDSVVLSNGSILSNAAGPGVVAANDGDITVQQLPAKETPRTKPSPNGCLQLNGTIKPSFLPLDNQRTQQMLSQCCHPCPYHHSLSSHNSKQECHSVVGSSAPSPMTSCCMQPHTEYSASICQKHTPVYQPACCLQPSPSFCLHHQWPDHFQHQPVQQHIARISFGVPVTVIPSSRSNKHKKNLLQPPGPGQNQSSQEAVSKNQIPH